MTTTTATRPEDFGVTQCGDGLTISKPGHLYQVHRNGVWKGATETLWDAMRLVEQIRGQN